MLPGALPALFSLAALPVGPPGGIDVRQIRLGVVQPGHGVASYNDALSRMTGNLYYLYNNNDRYFFHAEENLNKVANDRANNALSERAIDERIIEKLNDAMKEPRSRRRRRHPLLQPYRRSARRLDSVRLVVLPPNLSLPSRSGRDRRRYTGSSQGRFNSEVKPPSVSGETPSSS